MLGHRNTNGKFCACEVPRAASEAHVNSGVQGHTLSLMLQLQLLPSQGHILKGQCCSFAGLFSLLEGVPEHPLKTVARCVSVLLGGPDLSGHPDSEWQSHREVSQSVDCECVGEDKILLPSPRQVGERCSLRGLHSLISGFSCRWNLTWLPHFCLPWRREPGRTHKPECTPY